MYNGYPNKPTWSVALWLDNDAETYARVGEAARECVAEYGEMAASLEFVPVLRGLVDEVLGECDASLGTDLLEWALAQVDWDYLAGGYVDAVREEAAYASGV